MIGQKENLMSTVVRISEAVSLAMHGMVFLAAKEEELHSVGAVAEKLRVSKAHLQKVFQQLARVGLLKSNRGPNGGYCLGKRVDQITLLDIYEAIEGPMRIKNCLFDAPICKGNRCIYGNLLSTTQKRYQAYLDGMRLSELTDVYG
jgi:Rrf2 family nitric oxide-sensitive transcriptional repressor